MRTLSVKALQLLPRAILRICAGVQSAGIKYKTLSQGNSQRMATTVTDHAPVFLRPGSSISIQKGHGLVHYSPVEEHAEIDIANNPKANPSFSVFVKGRKGTPTLRVKDALKEDHIKSEFQKMKGTTMNHVFFIQRKLDIYWKGFQISSTPENVTEIEKRIRRVISSCGEDAYLELFELKDRLVYRVKDKEGITMDEGSCVQSHEDEFSAIHPAFHQRGNNSVFHTIESAVAVLEQCDHLPQARELLSIVESRELVEAELSQTLGKEQPFIVVEGLDGTGKTTLVKRISERLGASILQTPPGHIRHLRDCFDRQPPLIRRAYYTVGNYLVAGDVRQTCIRTPVIMDRFWHSTAAYAIAEEVGCGDEAHLPPSGHWVYQWPSDLLMPTAVVYLSVDEEQRRARISKRNLEITTEETALAASQLFRQRLGRVYERISGPRICFIDASPSPDSVLESTVANLVQMNVLKQ